MKKFNYFFKYLNIFTIFLLFFSIFYCFFNNKPIYSESGYYYTIDVEHLFTHCLIAYPEIAFKNDNQMSKHYLTDCITASEFTEILTQLHKNNYALIDITSCFQIGTNGQVIKNKVKVPVGKKPLIFGFDDVNYDSRKKGLGMVDKIIIDSNGELASYTNCNTKEKISYDNEFIPILENFIKKHPDFSINGAKGVINLTGYDGILGYRTSHTNKINRRDEINSAQKVVDKLKNNGWKFACHSYGHYHMNKISNEKFKQEISSWQKEVEPIIGKTDIYVYPFGEWQVFENGNLCKKHKMLQDAGFNLFCGVGMKSFFNYLPNKDHKVLFMDRKCVDGRTLSNNHNELKKFFNPLNVLDSTRNSNL